MNNHVPCQVVNSGESSEWKRWADQLIDNGSEPNFLVIQIHRRTTARGK
ncbi:unnamed protein product [Brassica oleracea var. botrytis]